MFTGTYSNISDHTHLNHICPWFQGEKQVLSNLKSYQTKVMLDEYCTEICIFLWPGVAISLDSIRS